MFPETSSSSVSAAGKRKRDDQPVSTVDVKRANVTSSLTSSQMEMDAHHNNDLHVFAPPHSSLPSSSSNGLPPRPTTPPLGMTLAHYDASKGGYTASVVASQNEVKSNICSGMTPLYRTPMERWGSCLL